MYLNVNPKKVDHLGFYNIEMKLTDNGSDTDKGSIINQKMTAIIEILIHVVDDDSFLSLKGGDGDPFDYDAYLRRVQACGFHCLPLMEMDQFTQLGEVSFRFDKPMVVPEDWSEWRGSNGAVEYGPILLQGSPGQLQNATKLAFTWNVTEFTATSLKFQIMFEYPLFISMGETRDTLIIKIMDRFALIDAENEFMLENLEYLRLIPT